MKYYDAHAHNILSQAGGFLIGLEGAPHFPGTLTNLDVFLKQDPSRLLFAVEYITRDATQSKAGIIKFHPRREKYTPEHVAERINIFRPSVCLIDTLNQPEWKPADYWGIARKFPDIQFLFCHAGGYDVLDFIKMADFTQNIWLDFSLTQEYFGWLGGRVPLASVCQAIDYGMECVRINQRILFGSDHPFFSQALAAERYDDMKNGELFLVENFNRLLERGKIL